MITVRPFNPEDPVERAAWLVWRRRNINASETPALFGEHPYKSELQLYQIKLGIISDNEETPAMERGTLMEEPTLKKLRRLHPDWDIRPPQKYYEDTEHRIGATPDLYVKIPGREGFGVIQVKSVEAGIFRRKWKDGAPLWIILQAVQEAHLTGASYAMVAASVASHGFDVHLYDVPLDTSVMQSVLNHVADFWHRVENRIEPEPTHEGDAKLLERGAAAGGTIDLRHDNQLATLADEDERLKADIAEAETRRKIIKSQFLSALAGAEVGFLSDGRSLVAKRIDVKVKPRPASEYSYIQVTIKEPRS